MKFQTLFSEEKLTFQNVAGIFTQYAQATVLSRVLAEEILNFYAPTTRRMVERAYSATTVPPSVFAYV